MSQDYIWDFYQNEMTEAFRGSLPRLKFLARKITKGERVLNIGVGSGLFEGLALERGLDVYSLDPNEKAISAVQQRFGMKEKARVGYSQDIPFASGFFHSVVISEVLEHLTEKQMDETLREVHRILDLNGRIIGSVPARENLKEQLVVCPRCGERFHRWGHAQSFDSKRLETILSRDFKVMEVFECVFVNWSDVNWKGKVLGLFKKALLQVSLHGSNENIVFVGMKCE